MKGRLKYRWLFTMQFFLLLLVTVVPQYSWADKEQSATVIAEIEQIDLTSNDYIVIEHQRDVVVYTEAELADFADPRFLYNQEERVSVLEARTVTPSGLVIEPQKTAMNVLVPHSLASFPDYHTFRELILSFIGIESGSHLKFKVEKKVPKKSDSLSFFEMKVEAGMYEAAVNDFSCSVLAPEELSLSYAVFGDAIEPEITTQPGQKSYNWSFKEIPALTAEELIPARDSLRPVLVLSTAHSWSEIARFMRSNYFHEGEVAETIKTKAMAVTKETMLPSEKIEKIHRYFLENMSVIKEHPSFVHYKIRSMDQVFNTHYGHIIELNALFNEFVRSLGGTTNLLCLQHKDLFSKNVPALVQFSDFAVEVTLEGYSVWLSLLHPLHAWNSDLLHDVVVFNVTDSGYEFVDLAGRKYSENSISSFQKITVDEKRNYSSSLQVSLKGSESLFYKLRCDLPGGMKTYCENFAEVSSVDSLALLEFNPSHTAFEVGFTGPWKTEKLADGFNSYSAELLPFNAFDSDILLPMTKVRHFPVQINHPFHYKQITEVTLPATITIIHLPKVVQLENDYGAVHLSIQNEQGKTLKFSRELLIKVDTFKAADYLKIRSLIMTFLDPKWQTVLLEDKEND